MNNQQRRIEMKESGNKTRSMEDNRRAEISFSLNERIEEQKLPHSTAFCSSCNVRTQRLASGIQFSWTKGPRIWHVQGVKLFESTNGPNGCKFLVSLNSGIFELDNSSNFRHYLSCQINEYQIGELNWRFSVAKQWANFGGKIAT